MKQSFVFAKEAGQNPFCGFNTFQHFQGEKLYSDVVVDPAHGMCETENLECYPVPDFVPENGRAQGFHPDGSVAYIRILWKEWEPKEGEYNDSFIRSILNDAATHGQTVMFRLMAHSTRQQDDVPDWLKALIPCPERPDGERVKDSPTDPLFLERFARAVRVLGDRFDQNPVLDMMDISLPGAWGEGHKLELFSDKQLQMLMDSYVEHFPNTHLISQIALPQWVSYIASKRPVGWRGDGIGTEYHTFEHYPAMLEKVPERDELWKTAPVAFESYWWLGEWYRQGWDAEKVFDQLLRWHCTYFNAKSLPIPLAMRETVDAFIGKMGYHFHLQSLSVPATVKSGENLTLRYTVENTGVAPIYRPLPLQWKLISETEDSFVFDSPVDIRRWLPGAHEETDVFSLPQDLPRGTYSLAMGIGNEVAPIVYWCNDLPRNDKFYTVGTVTVK